MKQITEDYVSFETAKLLKEKGFDCGCTGLYYENKKFDISLGLYSNSKLEKHDIKGMISAPTLQMTLKYLREVHKLHIFAKPYWPQGDMRNKMSWQGFIVDLNTINGDSQCYADSYEEAIENRIRFALENLI